MSMGRGKGNWTCRNLTKSQLGGVIFGCTNSTMGECLSKQLLGLPNRHYAYVKKIDIGLPLFLFNYSDRKIHGIFEAASPGQLHIDPYGWTDDGSVKTPYPAQVQIRVRSQCEPLTEEMFKPAIGDNYYTPTHFWFELDHVQTSKLARMLASSPIAPRPPMRTTKSKVWAISSTVKKDKSGDLPALGAEVSEHINPSVHEQKDCLEELVDSNRESGSSVPNSHSDVEGSCFGVHLDAQISEQKDKDCILEAVGSEHKDVAQTKTVEPPNLVSFENLDRDTLEEREVSVGKSEEGSLLSLHSQSIVDQLMHEMKELKAIGVENSTKINYLEKKLDEAEKEIQRLKVHCNMPKSIQGSCNIDTRDTMIKPLEDSSLDATESMFLLGGYDGESWLSSVHSYFPSRNVVKAHSSMSCVRSYAAVTKLDNKIYVYGGGDGHGWYDTAETYDLSSDQWCTFPPLAVSKGSLGGATLNGKLFAIGGGNGLESFSDVEMFDPDIGRWIRTKSMLQKRFSVAIVDHNNAIYAVGGFDGKYYLDTAERFDPREHSWTSLPTMKSRRASHSLVAFNEKLYTIGGFNGEKMVSSVEIYDPRMGTWMDGDPMNHMRGYSAAAVVKDSIYVIGGLKDENDILDTVECFKEYKGWEQITQTSIGKRCFLAAIASE